MLPFNSTTIISQKKKKCTYSYNSVWSAQGTALLWLFCCTLSKSTHFITAVQIGLPPSAEKPRFTGVPASHKTQAFPSSAKGKGAKITVQKQAAETYRERVLPEGRGQGTSYALTTAAPTPGMRAGPHAGGRRTQAAGAPNTPARRCAPPAPRQGTGRREAARA